jgi:hypothetical protein
MPVGDHSIVDAKILGKRLILLRCKSVSISSFRLLSVELGSHYRSSSYGGSVRLECLHHESVPHMGDILCLEKNVQAFRKLLRTN